MLISITQKLERCQSKLEEKMFALGNARTTLIEKGKKLAREQRRIDRERTEIQATEAGKVIAALRKKLAVSQGQVEKLEELRGLPTPPLSTSNAVIHGD
jgi:TRAP-type mannitol/chloroaromatic compound transport system substrate-binding protein